MLEMLEVFWDFFFAPLLQLDLDGPVYTFIVFSLMILCVFDFVTRLLRWVFSL